MNYIYKLLTVFLLAILTCNCGVMQQEEEYCPLDAGMSWEYNVTIKFPPIYGGDINTLMEVVNLPKRKFEKGEAVPRKYTLKNTKDFIENIFFEFIGIDKEGMFIYAEKSSMDPEPQILEYKNYFIKNYLKVGDNWQCDHESYNSRSSLVSIGTITVPVGNFDNCLKIKEEGVRKLKKDDILWRLFTLGRASPAKIRFESIYWYAPGVGMIKCYGSEEILGDERKSRWDLGNNFGKMKVEIHFELTSYNKKGKKQALKKMPIIGKDFKSSQAPGDTDIIAFIHKHTKALQDEDLETYMATLDEHSPNYALTLQQARLHFDMYDVVHKFEDIEVMEKSTQYAKVKLVHIVKKLRGPTFRDVKCTEIHTLKKVSGKWKIYTSEVTDIELLDQAEGTTIIHEKVISPEILGKDVSWAYTFGGPKEDNAYSVMQTSDGGYILVGSTESLRTDKADGFLFKTDEHGKKQWIRTFGEPYNHDEIYDVHQTLDGGYILTGKKGSNEDDVWLIKTDAQGIKQWERTFGGGKEDMGMAVGQTSDGGYILGCWTSSYGSGWMSAWLIKTDMYGRKQWDRIFGGSGGDMAYSVQQTSDGGYILAGWTASLRAGAADAWLIKTDSQGRKQWARTFGGPKTDSFTCVQQTPDRGYILGGSTKSYGAGKDDMWLVKTDPQGRKQWRCTFGGPDDDDVHSIQQTSDGGYILIGSTSHRKDKEDEWSTTKDIKLIKTDSHGKKQWERAFGQPYIDDEGKSVLQTPDGEYIMVSSTKSYGDKQGDVLLIKIKPEEFEYRKKIPFQYSDNFSSNIGWTNETSGDFTIRDGRLNWNAKRSRVQKMYIPIEGYSGDFRLNFDFQLAHRQNNVWLEVGLAESLTGSQNDPTNDPIGTFIKFGWIGGGTPYSVYYVIPLARYSNQGAYEGNFDFQNPSTYIAYTEDQWYNAMLEVSGTSTRLTVKDSRVQQVGQRTGSFPDGFGVYKYIYIGNPNNEDWPEGNGSLDNLKVKRLSSQPSPPGPPSDLNGVAVSKYKVKLEWQASSSGNPAKYNIYYDNGNGKINYNQSIGTVPHPTTTWISPALSKGITYIFGVRAENESGEKEKNADLVVSVKVIPLRQLTLQSGRDAEPFWSPGGSKIFYSSNYNIWEMNSVDGSGKKQLTQKGGEGPDCSPDNSKIVFMSNRNGERNVWITNIDGSAQQILTTESANYGPTWSPDGQEIIFASRRWRNGKIWRMKPDGSDQQHLTTGWSDDWAPDYSPDGSKIVFASIRTGKIHVWIMNADGSGQRQLTFDPEDKTLATYGWSGPVWSPDRRFIAFAHGIDSNHDNKIDWRDNDNIWTMNADGSKIFPITFSYSYDDENPAWSPDGTKIAFASNRSGNWDIWVTDYLYDSAAFPSANIVSPIMNQVINGDVPIIGTVSNNNSVDGITTLSLLSSWKLEYGEGTSPTQLIPIKNSSKQLTNNTLAIWHTAGLRGTYTIQLTVTDGKDFNVQRVVVNIQ